MARAPPNSSLRTCAPCIPSGLSFLTATFSPASRPTYCMKYTMASLVIISSAGVVTNAFADGTGEAEIDSRFRSMTLHHSLHHFKKGISLTSQWTGNEHKNMEKVFLGVIANATDPAVQRAVKGAMDFIYYAHFEIHCDESLSKMDSAWAAFHDNKHIFIDSGIRSHFDINKLHKLKHYKNSIRSRGTAPGFNTESTERLHIDLAKVGYKATNRKAYIKQMATWLRRQESVQKFDAYLWWAVPGYTVKSIPENDAEDAEGDEDEAEDEDEDNITDERVPTSLHSLAKTAHFPNLISLPLLSPPISTRPTFCPNSPISWILDSKSITPPEQPTAESTFSVYKHFGLPLPAISEAMRHVIRDKVRAAKGEPMKIISTGTKPSAPELFDTVLVRTQERATGESPTAGLAFILAVLKFLLMLDEY
ncbi:hypothetical protein B0H13DRAFT_2371633 [Mycena leptocephala]|nr:hypothetical protein B0H13DRAFT_2371633 [Mycena leptocephala]